MPDTQGKPALFLLANVRLFLDFRGSAGTKTGTMDTASNKPANIDRSLPKLTETKNIP
jgi:hypothetical protein